MNDLQQHITSKPMKVLGYGNVCGIDTSYWNRNNVDTRQVERIRKDSKFTFIFVGRIVKDKGINELIEAFVHVHENHKVRLVLVGRYEDKIDPISKDTRRIIDECDDIIYAGPQFGKDLLAYYAAADCFVLPSYREGFPNVVIEAGAMGLPSIVTDINGSREIIENGKNGVVIPPKNAAVLAKAMVYIIEDVGMRQLMVSNARPMIASRFERSFVNKCLQEFYDEIMS